jgi:O-antigen/teichoic acid export membrane protein
VKWEPSVHFFKILALSGFSYPISALLVNVLNSRGNSKAFLRLEIYKKTLVLMNFFILYFYGIDYFLYGLVVTAIINVSWNILFASKEIYIPFLEFAKPIVTQALIAIISVSLIVAATSFLELPMMIVFITQGLLFGLCYLFLSWILKTESYQHIEIQTKPYLEKFRSRL